MTPIQMETEYGNGTVTVEKENGRINAVRLEAFIPVGKDSMEVRNLLGQLDDTLRPNFSVKGASFAGRISHLLGVLQHQDVA